MGVFKNIGRAISKGVKDTGHFVGKAADNKIVQGLTAAALTATGVGAPAAAAILAAEAGGGKLLKPGGNIGQAAGGALRGAAMAAGGAIAGKLGGVVSKIPMVGSAVQKVGSLVSHLPGGDVVPQSALDGLSQVEQQIGGGINGGTSATAADGSPSVLSQIAKVGSSVLPRNQDGSIDWTKLAQVGLGAGAAYEGVNKSRQESAAQKEALQLSQADAAARAKLLGQGTGMMTAAQTRPDLSNIFDTGNPYAPRKRLVAVGASAPAGGY